LHRMGVRLLGVHRQMREWLARCEGRQTCMRAAGWSHAQLLQTAPGHPGAWGVRPGCPAPAHVQVAPKLFAQLK
jgi:hypothetical protein